MSKCHIVGNHMPRLKKIELKKNKITWYCDGVRTRNLYDSGQVIYPLCYEFSMWFVCAYNIFDVIKCMYYFKITIIIANTECQHSQNNAAGLSTCRCLCSLTEVRTFATVYIYVHRYVKKLNLNFKVASLLPWIFKYFVEIRRHLR